MGVPDPCGASLGTKTPPPPPPRCDGDPPPSHGYPGPGGCYGILGGWGGGGGVFWGGGGSLTHPMKQWAAVSTQLSATSAPPQRCSPRSRRLTAQGQEGPGGGVQLRTPLHPAAWGRGEGRGGGGGKRGLNVDSWGSHPTAHPNAGGSPPPQKLLTQALAVFQTGRWGGVPGGAKTVGGRRRFSQPAWATSPVANTGPLGRAQPTAKLSTPACTHCPPGPPQASGPPESAWGSGGGGGGRGSVKNLGGLYTSPIAPKSPLYSSCSPLWPHIVPL